MSGDAVFKLSRIYAQGWNAANKLSVDDSLAFDEAAIAALNPYRVEPELSRWNEGFAHALRK